MLNMREIKFRGWDRLNKEMIILNTFWFIGIPAHIYNEKFIENANWVEYFNARGIEPMQYTGLKDSQGIDIYEGDIVKTDEGNKAIDFDILTYDSGGAVHTGFYFKGSDLEWSMNLDEYEVIGNIYENPDLLK